jgi:Na+/melibiose symporter-like transporter
MFNLASQGNFIEAGFHYFMVTLADADSTTDPIVLIGAVFVLYTYMHGNCCINYKNAVSIQLNRSQKTKRRIKNSLYICHILNNSYFSLLSGVDSNLFNFSTWICHFFSYFYSHFVGKFFKNLPRASLKHC